MPHSAQLPELRPHELQRLPIFPLPGVTLFPHTLLPLHIFEPRYRQMTSHVLEHDLPLAIAVLRPGYQEDYHGRPPVHEILGVGRVVHHERLPDDRFNLVLRGVGRAKLLRELPPDDPWREVEASLLPDQISDPAQARALVDALRGFAFGLGQQHGRLAGLLVKRLQTLSHPGALADSLLSSLLSDLPSRLEALGEVDVNARLDRLHACLSHFMLQGPQPQGQPLH